MADGWQGYKQMVMGSARREEGTCKTCAVSISLLKLQNYTFWKKSKCLINEWYLIGKFNGTVNIRHLCMKNGHLKLS